VPATRLTGVLALAAGFAVSCGSRPIPHAIDPLISARVPAGATILAGVNLDRLRASPLHEQLPPAALALLEPLRDASFLLVAANASDYVAISRGSFHQAPAGATLLAPGMAALGSPDWLRAVGTSHQPEAPLLQRAEPLAATSELWMVTEGNANLPLSGNGENLNRLLHMTQYTTWSVRLTNNVTVEAVGMCDGPETAQRLEETVRAFLSLGGAANARRPEMRALLKRIQLRREDRTVHLSLTAEPAEMEQLFKIF
jgi:hypothetical protein